MGFVFFVFVEKPGANTGPRYNGQCKDATQAEDDHGNFYDETKFFHHSILRGGFVEFLITYRIE